MTRATRLEAHLVCDRCGHRERITERTRFTECPCCGWPRSARDLHGRAVVVWRGFDRLTQWGLAA